MNLRALDELLTPRRMERSRELLERARLAAGEARRAKRASDAHAAELAELGLDAAAIEYALGWHWTPTVRAAERRSKWWGDRGRALERLYTERTAECEVEGVASRVELVCRAEGTVRTVPARCGQKRWCDPCAKRRRGGWYKRVKRGLANRHREELEAWNKAGRPRGMRPDVELVTLTAGRPGDGIVERRRIISKGWKRLRAWLHNKDGRALPFVLAWELTKGADELGHPHAHAAVVWPWRNLPELNDAWVRATDGASVNIDVRGHTKAKHARIRGLSSAVSYLAAYVAKGGASTGDLQLDADWHELHARGARVTSSSRGALAPPELIPTCPECGGFELVASVKPAERSYTCTATGPPEDARSVRLTAAIAP